MNRAHHKTSRTSFLVIVLLACSIVCAATALSGRVIPAQAGRVIKRETSTAQFTTQLAEQSESETKTETKHDTPLFTIQTVIHLFRFDAAAPAVSGFITGTRGGADVRIIPLYLVVRTLRI